MADKKYSDFSTPGVLADADIVVGLDDSEADPSLKNSSWTALQVFTYMQAKGLGQIQTDNVIYVAENGNDGTGQRNRLDLAFLTLQAAFDASQDGDLIFVINGNYDGQISIAAEASARSLYLHLQDGVTITNTANAAVFLLDVSSFAGQVNLYISGGRIEKTVGTGAIFESNGSMTIFALFLKNVDVFSSIGNIFLNFNVRIAEAHSCYIESTAGRAVDYLSASPTGYQLKDSSIISLNECLRNNGNDPSIINCTFESLATDAIDNLNAANIVIDNCIITAQNSAVRALNGEAYHTRMQSINSYGIYGGTTGGDRFWKLRHCNIKSQLSTFLTATATFLLAVDIAKCYFEIVNDVDCLLATNPTIDSVVLDTVIKFGSASPAVRNVFEDPGVARNVYAHLVSANLGGGTLGTNITDISGGTNYLALTL